MVSIENIQKTTAEYYNIKLSDLLSKEGVGPLQDQDKWQWPSPNSLQITAFQEIGEAFNGRDHTTVLHACKKIAELRKESPSHEKITETLTERQINGFLYNKRRGYKVIKSYSWCC